MNVLIIPDPDEWVQKPRIPFVIIIDHSKLEEFGENALNMRGKDLRAWLHLHGIKSTKNFALSELDYVVCSW